MNNKQEQLKEFAQILFEKDRKKINEWKEENHMLVETGICEERFATDAETIEYLIDISEGVEKYIKYLDEEDPSNRDCKFRNSKSKQQFINDYLA